MENADFTEVRCSDIIQYPLNILPRDYTLCIVVLSIARKFTKNKYSVHRFECKVEVDGRGFLCALALLLLLMLLLSTGTEPINRPRTLSTHHPRAKNTPQAYLGDFDQKNLCKNPTLKGTNPVTNADTRDSAGCRRVDVL